MAAAQPLRRSRRRACLGMTAVSLACYSRSEFSRCRRSTGSLKHFRHLAHAVPPTPLMLSSGRRSASTGQSVRPSYGSPCTPFWLKTIAAPLKSSVGLVRRNERYARGCVATMRRASASRSGDVDYIINAAEAVATPAEKSSPKRSWRRRVT